MKARCFFFGSLMLLASFPAANAAQITKGSSGNFDVAGSWTGAVLPTSSDIALFNSTSGTTSGIGAGLSLLGIKVTNASAYTISAGTGSLTLGTSGIDMLSASNNLTINAPIVLNGSQQWNVASGKTLTISGTSGLNQGSSNITLNGLGTVTFSPTATFTAATGSGTTTVNGGTLNLSNGNVNGLTNALSSSSVLAVGGGSVQMTAVANLGTFTQNFASTTVNAGASSFFSSRGANAQWVINLGSVTRNAGGTVNLSSSNNAASGFKFGNGSNGIIGGFLTINGTDFVKFTNATTFVGNNGVTAPTYTNDTWSGANNTTITTDSTQTGATTNSLRFGAASARTLTLSGTNTLTSGGLLVSSGVGAFNNVITGGTLRGASGADLIVHQHNTGGTLTIASVIADNTSATALTKSGAGTLILSGANSFTGGVYLNAGTVQLASSGALNLNAVTFTNNSSGKLQLNGNSATVSGLNTSTVVAGTLPTVENANGSGATLTVNNSSANTFAGTLQDGTGAGTLGLTKTGSGTLTLSGSNTSTGATSITGGTLALTGTTGLASTSISIGSSGTLDVSGRTGGSLTLGASQTVSGLGTVTGGLSAVSGTTFNPGGNANIGSLTIGSLSVSSGSILNFELPNSGTTSDLVTVSTSSGLVLAGTGITINLSPTSGGSFAGGIGNTYNLFSYSGSLSGGGTSGGNLLSNTFAVGNAVGGLTYTFANTGSNITVTIGGSLATDTSWQVGGANTSWNTTGNWGGGTVPQAAGDSARFGSAIGATPTTVTLDGNKSLALIEFNHSGAAYTIAQGSSGTLTMDNGVSVAQITNTAGSHSITAPVSLSSNTAVSVVGSGDALTISGAIDGAGSLTKTGAGTLNLTSSNSFTGGVSLNAGTLSFVSGALGTTGPIGFGGGILKYAAGNTDDLSSSTVSFSGQAQIDTNGNDVSYASAIGNGGSGGLTKLGAGKLSLASGNTFTGANTLIAGTLNLASDTSLGAVPGSAATNLTINPGSGNTATLQAGASLSLNANRSIVISSGTAAFDTQSNNLTVGGAISGSGILNKSGSGSLTLNGVGTYASTVVDAGTVIVGNNSALGSGSVTLNGTSSLNLGARNLANVLVVNGTNGLTSGDGGGVSGINTVTGSGTLNVSISGGNVDLRGNMAGFSGTLALASGGNFRFNGSGGSSTFTLDLANGSANVRNGATVITLGALKGNSTSSLNGSAGGATQAVNYTIGGLGSNTTFSGSINNGAAATSLTKVGSGSLTLAGTSTYTGATSVSAGSLLVNGALGNTAVSVTAGTLGGTGSIGGSVTMSGTSSYSPGASPGSLEIAGDLSLGSSTTTTIELGGTSFTLNGTEEYDRTKLTGSAATLTVGGTLNVSLYNSFVLGANQAFGIFQLEPGATLTGTFAGLGSDGSLVGNFGGTDLFITYSGNFGDSGTVSAFGGNDIVLYTIPEPTVALLGSLGLLGLLRRRR